MKYSFYAIFSLLYYQCLAQEVKSPAVLFKDFTGFRERIRSVDNKVRYRYTITGKEYNIEILPLQYYGLITGKQGASNLAAKVIKKKADYFTINLVDLPFPNSMAYQIVHVNDTISITRISYVFPSINDSILYKIDMSTFFKRDSSLEKEIVHSILNHGIYDSILISPGPQIINFAGRLIEIKTRFNWMGPNNIYCPEKGQMNWSEHETLYNANVARDVQMHANTSRKIAEVIKRDTIIIQFENIRQSTLRITYKANVPKIFWGRGSKILIVYYVVSFRDGHYITTVLSHYDDQLLNGDVPPPLNSVMSIKD